MKVLTRPPTNTVHDENLDYLRQMSSLYLGSFGGKDLVVQLIQPLTNEYWIIRYWIVTTLGDIKETQAIPYLILKRTIRR
ncbi:MAG: HEAT repeat domain-containing protein [Cyanobacteria bacterium J06573_2]